MVLECYSAAVEGRNDFLQSVGVQEAIFEHCLVDALGGAIRKVDNYG